MGCQSFFHYIINFLIQLLLRELKSHRLLGWFIFSNFFSFKNCSVVVLTRRQKSAYTSGRSMASSCWKVLTSLSATLHTIHPRYMYSSSVITSLLLASNYTISLSADVRCHAEYKQTLVDQDSAIGVPTNGSHNTVCKLCCQLKGCHRNLRSAVCCDLNEV